MSDASKIVAAITVLAAAAAAPAAWAATAKDVLVIGKSADPQTLDPGVTVDNNDWTVTYPAYQRLVRYKTENGKGLTSVEGDLATKWTVSADNLAWDFTLKPGNSFADGTPVDAAAVKFSFDRLFALKQGPSEAFPDGTVVTVVNPTTVHFQLKTPFAPFLYTLANNGAAIVNPKVMEHQKDGDQAQGWLSGHTAGSGPYQLTSWEKGQSIVLEPNPKFAGPKPPFSKVITKIVAEASARRLQLEGGDLDIAEDLPGDQLDALKKAGNGITVSEYPSLKVTYLYLNNKRPPLDKPEVRRAIVAAIDDGAIIDGILLGKGKPMGGPIPEGMWGYDASIKPAAHDPAAAKALLKSAGAEKIKLSFVMSNKDPNWEPIALATQSNLAEVGATVSIENIANATFRERLGKGDFDIAIGNWSPDFSDPYMFMNYWFDSGKQGLSGNRSFYSNPKVDELVRKAAVESNQAERTKLYQEAQKITVADAAYVYLFQKNSQVALRSDVKGFVFNPMLEQIYNVDEMSKSK
ncbi:MAG TPA: ABC transporter substrate-binding protein [Aliidongia sp.]|uniref:ABC transporter substrate-binding protein n=1 Tax=Aliidongia sp. TaxID=1914230 RepID=UPI002DDD781D|nr:ABC transporter substrate-binding protein [Aliidongia sp.]HEV2677408.1 ABC transporter substrate-binding protein [Aliidongia sp.]